jgi:hypothetical protein
MKNNTRRFVAIVVIGLALMMPINIASADSENIASGEFGSFEKLSAEWWQWALSIPTSENPLLDTTGEKCAVGPAWFCVVLGWHLWRRYGARTCTAPEDKIIYFPVINSLNINTPNVCGQDSNNIPVSALRAASAALIDEAANLSVTVDGIAIKNLRRVKSEVFVVALPKENVFVAPCAPLNVPPGIYSPAVDDGFYVLLRHPLQRRASSLFLNSDGTRGHFEV